MALYNGTSNNFTHQPIHFAYCVDRPFLNYSLGGPIFVYTRIGIDIVIITSIIAVNILLICAIVTYRRDHRGSSRVSNSSATTKFVLMLAISDVLVGVCAPAYLIPHYLCDLDDHIRINKYLCTMKYVLTVFAAVMSNMSLVFIAVDRYIAIEYTLRYRIIMSRRICHAMIGGQVIFSAATGSILFFWNNWPGQSALCDLEDVVPSNYVIVVGFILHTIILIMVVGVHVQLHRKASALNSRKSVIQMELHVINRDTPNPNLKSAKVVLLVVGVYFICWTPYTISLIVRASHESITPVTDLIVQICFPFSIANSLINPFIYAWKNNEIYGAVIWFIKRNPMKCLNNSI